VAKDQRDFSTRPLQEQAFLLENTWCDACSEADLGIESPTEYMENGQVFLEGYCRQCGSHICSEIIVKGE